MPSRSGQFKTTPPIGVLMSRVIPRFDTLAAAKYDTAPSIEKRHRTNLEEVFGENLFGLQIGRAHV